MDHNDDNEVLKLFEKIKEENNGRLDVLVNNAYAGVDMIFSNARKKFHEMDPVSAWDTINGVGLRNHFLCTTYASRLKIVFFFLNLLLSYFTSAKQFMKTKNWIIQYIRSFFLLISD